MYILDFFRPRSRRFSRRINGKHRVVLGKFKSVVMVEDVLFPHFYSSCILAVGHVPSQLLPQNVGQVSQYFPTILMLSLVPGPAVLIFKSASKGAPFPDWALRGVPLWSSFLHYEKNVVRMGHRSHENRDPQCIREQKLALRPS